MKSNCKVLVVLTNLKVSEEAIQFGLRSKESEIVIVNAHRVYSTLYQRMVGFVVESQFKLRLRFKIRPSQGSGIN